MIVYLSFGVGLLGRNPSGSIPVSRSVNVMGLIPSGVFLGSVEASTLLLMAVSAGLDLTAFGV